MVGCTNKDREAIDDRGKRIVVIEDAGYHYKIRVVEIEGARYVVVTGPRSSSICPAQDSTTKK